MLKCPRFEQDLLNIKDGQNVTVCLILYYKMTSWFIGTGNQC